MLKLRLRMLIAALFLVASPVLAQTSLDLRQRYGPPVGDTFFARPDVVIIAPCATDSRPCDMRIEPQQSSGGSKSSEWAIKPSVADEIIDEVVPQKLRGELIGEGLAEFGQSSMRMTFYEHVEVSRAMTLYGTPAMSIRFVAIKWGEYHKSGESDAPPN